jgi:hypothetical protein
MTKTIPTLAKAGTPSRSVTILFSRWWQWLISSKDLSSATAFITRAS